MNNAKMWLVVPPAVGVPVFLGAVAVGSFAVHVAVLSNTSWVSDFLSGVPMGTGDQQTAALELKDQDLTRATASYIQPTGDGYQVTVILPDGTPVMATLHPSEVEAAFRSPPVGSTTH